MRKGTIGIPFRVFRSIHAKDFEQPLLPMLENPLHIAADEEPVGQGAAAWTVADVFNAERAAVVAGRAFAGQG